MKTHPIEYLPAYALDALSSEDTCRIEAHLAVCPGCRAEVEAFRVSVKVVSDQHAPSMPPRHVKRQLMARIQASTVTRPRTFWQNMSRVFSLPALPRVLVLCSLVLAFAFGSMMVDARRRLAEAQTALQALEQEQHANEQVIAAFLSDPATVSQPLNAVQSGVRGTMYMQAGNRRVVLVASGLAAPAPGATYQFWFANGATQAPSGTFSVDAAGLVQAVLEAPNAVNTYAEVMVTVEPLGGSTMPSNQIVLAAKLAT